MYTERKKPHFESAPKQSGDDEKLRYTEGKKPVTHTAQNTCKNRQRKITGTKQKQHKSQL